MAVATGTGFTVKLPLLVAVPPGPVTVIVPVAADGGKVATISVELLTVNELAGVPLKLTAVVPLKFIPVIITTVPLPEQALVGVKPVIPGTAVVEIVIVPEPEPVPHVLYALTR